MKAVRSPDDALLDEFCDTLWLEDGLARNTLESYRRDLRQFADVAAERERQNLHAWRDLTVTGLGETVKPYINSIIVAFFSTVLGVLVGSMAAYALARIEYRPKFGTIVLFVLALLGMAVAVGMLGVDWRLAAAAAIAVFVLLARALGRRFKRAVGNGDILFWMISQRILPPVVTVIPIYMMFQQVGLLDTASRADPLLHGRQPADRGLADARLLRRRADRPRGERPARRRLALHDLLRDRAAAGPGGARRHHAAGADPVLERVPAGALPLDHATPRRCRSWSPP